MSLIDYGFVMGPIEDDNIFESEWRVKCMGVCKWCGKPVGIKLNQPKVRFERGRGYPQKRLPQEWWEKAVRESFWNNHGMDCPKRIILAHA